MWFQENYVKQVKQAIRETRLQDAAKWAVKAFKDKNTSEQDLAWIAGCIYDTRLSALYPLMSEFCERFPQSAFPVQAMWGEALCQQGDLDGGSNEARTYLRRLHGSAWWESFLKTDIYMHAIVNAFRTMTMVYLQLGAISYAQRVLQYAISLPISEEARDWLQQTIDRSAAGMSQPQFSQITQMNEKWEEFFHKGAHLEELMELCKQQKAAILGQRLILIAQNFKADSDYKVDDKEILQLVVLINNPPTAMCLA